MCFINTQLKLGVETIPSSNSKREPIGKAIVLVDGNGIFPNVQLTRIAGNGLGIYNMAAHHAGKPYYTIPVYTARVGVVIHINGIYHLPIKRHFYGAAGYAAPKTNLPSSNGICAVTIAYVGQGVVIGGVGVHAAAIDTIAVVSLRKGVKVFGRGVGAAPVGAAGIQHHKGQGGQEQKE